MKSRAAVAFAAGKPLEIVDIRSTRNRNLRTHRGKLKAGVIEIGGTIKDYVVKQLRNRKEKLM